MSGKLELVPRTRAVLYNVRANSASRVAQCAFEPLTKMMRHYGDKVDGVELGARAFIAALFANCAPFLALPPLVFELKAVSARSLFIA